MIENMQQKTKCVEASATSRCKLLLKVSAVYKFPLFTFSQRRYAILYLDEPIEILRIFGGNFKPDAKLSLIQHDNTIASLFATLGFPKTNYKSDGYPSYAACLAVELRKHHQTQTYYVKVLMLVHRYVKPAYI